MQKIDIEIIWEKYHDVITKEENKQLQTWLNSNKHHQKYFDDIIRFYSEGSVFDKSPAETQVAWENISKQLQTSHKKRSTKLILYASSVAASILVILSLIFFFPKDDKYTEVDELVQQIEPGADKAMLILDDGSSFNLSANNKLSIEEGGTKINSHGTGIQYIRKKESKRNIKYNTLSIPRGGEFFLLLSDSTKVWLNSETILRYPVQFSGNERKVELIGEAFFEVTQNKNKPFIVVSNEQIVEVLGTSFNISSYKEDSIIYTTLVKGKVDVYMKKKNKVKQTLSPNYQTCMYKNAGQISQRKVNTDQYIAWKEGRFVFENKPLSQMMNTLSKWYNVDVVFENEKARDIEFTGELKRYESFEKVMAIIEKTQEVKIETNERIITIN